MIVSQQATGGLGSLAAPLERRDDVVQADVGGRWHAARRRGRRRCRMPAVCYKTYYGNMAAAGVRVARAIRHAAGGERRASNGSEVGAACTWRRLYVGDARGTNTPALVMGGTTREWWHAE
jgi:hypothetical protein